VSLAYLQAEGDSILSIMEGHCPAVTLHTDSKRQDKQSGISQGQTSHMDIHDGYHHPAMTLNNDLVRWRKQQQ
jgi:hypothetical protein